MSTSFGSQNTSQVFAEDATSGKPDIVKSSASALHSHDSQASKSTTLLNAVTATGAGTSVLKTSTKSTFQGLGTTSSGTGSATIKVQVSNNDTDWIDLGTITLSLTTTSSSDGFTSEAPWRHVRGNVTAISGTGASVTLLMGT